MRPGATGMRISGTRKPSSSKNDVVEPEPIVFALRIPAFELHDELDALRRPRRRDAEQIAEVDEAEPAHFHVMPRQLRAAADDDRRRAAADLDGVVGDEPMAAHDQVERALALADAALPDHQHAEAENVEQHAVDHFADGEAILEQRRQLADRRGRADPRRQQRHAGAVAPRTRSGGASRPPVTSTHGTAVANDCASACRAPRASSPSR